MFLESYWPVEKAPGTEIGYDREQDREGYAVAGHGITIIPRAAEKTCWTTFER